MHPPLPNFTDSDRFPVFSEIPLTPSSSTPSDHEDYFLLGTIHENMTLTPLTPTFICRDRSGASFALTIKLRPGQDSDSNEKSFYKSKEGRSKFKKGACVAVRGARRKGYKEDDGTGKRGKHGFVEVGWEEGRGGVAVIPASLDKLLAMSETWKNISEEEQTSKVCHGCKKNEKSVDGKLVRCKGCEGVWYCGKECQVKGWNENGHKSECKVLKAINEVLG